jgi:hypothetical protein
MPQRIHETAVLPAVDAEAAKSGRLLVEIISEGIGSSGAYPRKVLENAVTERVWPQGTKVFIDHPTESETYARPARTVKDLVGRTTRDAYIDESGRIVTEVKIFKPFRPLLTDADFIQSVGMSIRAAAEVRPGEYEGKKTTVVTRLIPDVMNTIDVVTWAGRGGRVISLLESLRTPTDSEADATEAAVSDQREALADALNAAYGGEKSYVGIRDFDPEAGRVWFWYENPTGSGTYQVDYEADESGSITLTGDPIEVRAKTVYVPIATQPTEAASTNVPAPAGQHHPPTESKEDTMPEIEAGRLAQLEEAAGRVPTLTDERDQAVSRAEAAEAALRNHRNVDAARGILAEAAAASTTPVTFSALEQRGILAALPTTDAGDLDAAAFRSAVETEVNAKAKQSGAGRVSGFGVTEDAGGKAVPTWDDIDSIYGRKEA